MTPPSDTQPEIVEVELVTAAVVRDVVDMSAMSEFFDQAFGQILVAKAFAGSEATVQDRLAEYLVHLAREHSPTGLQRREGRGHQDAHSTCDGSSATGRYIGRVCGATLRVAYPGGSVDARASSFCSARACDGLCNICVTIFSRSSPRAAVLR